MTIKLLKADAQILEDFKSLTDFSGVAHLLEVPLKTLYKATHLPKNYTEILISKKNSTGKRTIKKPNNNLDIIQKKLNYILNLFYKRHHTSSHGFVSERSIVTNATSHINAKILLQFDLKDFFSSINFARIRAIFISVFKVNPRVATILANLCVDENNLLPQGASTSPLIANIASYKLDQQLSSIAKKNKCCYTRYADDMSFSSNSHKFPEDIFCYEENNLSNKIINIINNQGFIINSNKTRLLKSNQSMYVTGIKVNTKLNVNRRYIRRVRSILHTIEKNMDDLATAERLFQEKYNFRSSFSMNKNMFLIIRGMIGHIGNVKGKNDPLFKKLAKRYNDINRLLAENNGVNNPYIKIPATDIELQERNTFVVDSDRTVKMKFYSCREEVYYEQGTAFNLNGIGIVTNSHVVKDLIKYFNDEHYNFEDEYYITVHNSIHGLKKHLAKIVFINEEIDVAVLQSDTIDHINYGFKYNLNINKDDAILTLGYPDFRAGNTLRVEKGYVMGIRVSDRNPLHRRLEVSTKIPGGNSGGPILNIQNEVVAIAVKGSDGVPSEVIPIKLLIDCLK